MLKTQSQTVPTRRCSVFNYMPIYNLLIITITDLELIAVPYPTLLGFLLFAYQLLIIVIPNYAYLIFNFISN